jgi:uncharacterized membrane protein YczE
MDKDNTIAKPRRLLLFSVAVIVLGMGIALCDHAQFGTDPFSVLCKGLSVTVGIPLSAANAILCGGQIVVAWFFNRRDLSWGTVISLFASTLGIQLMDNLLPSDPSLQIRIILMLLGVMVYSFGIAWSMIFKVGLTTYDCFIYALERIFHTDKYHTLRWIADGANMVIGWLIGGVVGLTTVVLLLFSGSLVELWLKLLKRGNTVKEEDQPKIPDIRE